MKYLELVTLVLFNKVFVSNAIQCYFCSNCIKSDSINSTVKECLAEESNCYVAELSVLGTIEQNCASEISFLFADTYLQPAQVCSNSLCNVYNPKKLSTTKKPEITIITTTTTSLSKSTTESISLEDTDFENNSSQSYHFNNKSLIRTNKETSNILNEKNDNN
ncbi:unnamed protein product [Brachionus calyciflorus]|uniref:Uncharacterized protein n=1 Tax=Brachionus calyciflorus TaxID=104777 RepID=A0A813NKV6_9BILA|nr:unnamed protein product [Brachionus calyciflorus]